MSKKKNNSKNEATEKKTLSTTKEMVIREGLNEEINDKVYDVIAQDENGFYFTQKIWIGNNLMDPCRHQDYRRRVTSLTDRHLALFGLEKTSE